MAEKRRKKSLGEKKSNEEKLEAKLLRQSEMAEIFDLTESRIKKSDKKKKEEIIKLVGGGELNITVLASNIQNHPSQFYLEFYQSVFKILNLSGDPSAFGKPKEVADFTVELIYNRFKKEDFTTILLQNKFVGMYRRRTWHYQFLNEKGIKMLQTFISDVISCISVSADYYSFRKEMYSRHGIKFQKSLFDQGEN